jgi:CRP-like cAMP-binding protein/cytochrome P450
VFRLAYPGRTMILLAGLDANRLFATRGGELFSAAETYRRVTREVGTARYPNALDGHAHRDLRQLLAPSLSALGVEPFLPEILKRIRERVSSWSPGSASRLSARVAPLVADVVGLCTMGRPVGGRLSRDIYRYGTMMGVIAVGKVLPEFTLYLPPMRRARSRIARRLEAMIDDHRERRAGLEREPDYLDALLAAGDLDPDTLQALAMIPMKNAGIYLYRLVSFALHEILRTPALLERVRGEVDTALAAGTPGLRELRSMDTLQRVILESLRRYPMAIALPRVVARDFEFGGFAFEPGQTVYIAGPAVHFDPELFADPDRFDPDRYLPERSEHRQPYAYAPFGFGAHACAARGYSQTLAAAVVAGLLHAAELRLVAPGRPLRLRGLPNPIPEARFRFRVAGHREALAAAAPPSFREGLSDAFGELEPELQAAISLDLERRTWGAGETILRQGAPPDRFHVIRTGEVEVVLEEAGRERRLARLGPGQPFGEIGLLQGIPRTATVRAITRVSTLSLGRDAFNALAVHGGVTRQELVGLMHRRELATRLVRSLAEADAPLAGLYRSRELEAGTAILRQGEAADRFYLLMEGRVAVLLERPGRPEIPVAELEAVDFFGEVGLLQRRPRTATVRAVTAVTLLEVPEDRFRELVADGSGEDLARIAGERLLELSRAG